MCIFFSISLSPTTSISNAYRVLTRFVFTVSPLHLFRAPLTTTKFAQQLLAHVWQQNDKPAVTGRWVQQQQQQSAEAQKTVKETPQKKKKTVSSDTHSSARTGRRNLFGFFLVRLVWFIFGQGLRIRRNTKVHSETGNYGSVVVSYRA